MRYSREFNQTHMDTLIVCVGTLMMMVVIALIVSKIPLPQHSEETETQIKRFVYHNPTMDEIKKSRTEEEKEEVIEQMKRIEELAREKYPTGTYVLNTETKQIGRCVKYQEYIITTDTEWSFNFVEDEKIEYCSYKQYKDYRNKLQNKIKKQENERLIKESEALKPQQEKMLKEMFPPNPKYAYIMHNGVAKRVKGYDGLYLITDKKEKIFYQEAKKIGFKEYDEQQIGKKK